MSGRGKGAGRKQKRTDTRVDRKPQLADQADRDAIRAEREQNLLVIAGAGTGKTSSIIDRVVAFLAPETESHAPVPIERLAIITFTRRAAGELRFRVRERLLEELARLDPASRRAQLLRQALPALDAAAIGTIHGFADRLLKLRPVEARLSPAYAVAEESLDLVSEAFRRLRRGAETGQLAEELRRGGGGTSGVGTSGGGSAGGGSGVGSGVGGAATGMPSPELVAEAAETLRAATRGELQMERRENAFGPIASLEDIVGRMIDTRDVGLVPPAMLDPELDRMREALAELQGLAARVQGSSRGPRHVRKQIHELRRLESAEDAAEAFAILKHVLGGPDLLKGRDFRGADNVSWWLFKTLRGEQRGKGIIPPDLGDRLRGPYRWLATRIVRLARVVEAMYSRVKEEHELVDYLDLLVKLRDLLRDDRDARRFYQERYDHIFVDEFQDTDPLQCEVLFYLCEDGTEASEWGEVQLRPGRLTLVGDPKQSIYRFRRADVMTYARAEEMLRAQGARVLTLSTNFRSQPELVRYYNLRLAELLDKGPVADERGGRGRRARPQLRLVTRGDSEQSAGTGPTGSAVSGLDPNTGQAFYEPLTPAPGIPSADRPVHVLPYSDRDGEPLTVVAGGREIEAELIARYLRWLLGSATQVRDPVTGKARRVRAGDIAVLTPVTTSLHLLLAQLDRRGIEHSIRGGTLFLSQPLVRRYLLALRSLADRDDGVAEAALLSPPFFALDELDLAVSHLAGRGDVELTAIDEDEIAERRARVDEARALVRELRAVRHSRSPGATARDLIERTGLGRAVLAGANGRQTLTALYEVAFEVERRGLSRGLDFDAATVLPRSWAEAPVYLDMAEPLGDDAVRVMTTYQAKGLEFPVVVLWDGFQRLSDRVATPWIVGRDGRSWALNLRPVSIEEPAGSDLIEQEKVIAKHERARLYYVAATRARDLLVLPVPATRGRGPYATGLLAAVEGEDEGLVRRFEPFAPGAVPEWAKVTGDDEAIAPRIVADGELDRLLDETRAAFTSALERAALPVALPRAITALAAERVRGTPLAEDVGDGDGHLVGVEAELAGSDESRAAKAEKSRFGKSFGIAVHRALELVLSGSPDVHEEVLEGVVETAVATTGLGVPAAERPQLAALRDEVKSDVGRALEALASAGLSELTLSTEVDVTAPASDGILLRGVIDLLAVGPDAAFVIDWKTDAPVAGKLAAAYPVYAEQLRLYLEAIRSTGLAGERRLRAGLVLTASGELKWLD